MRLLSRVVHGQLADGIEISDAVRDDLVVACLELLIITPRLGETLPGARDWLRVIGEPNSQQFDPRAFQRQHRWTEVFGRTYNRAEGHPPWALSLGAAFRHLHRARRAVEGSGRTDAELVLDNLIVKIWHLAYLTVWSGQNSDTYWGTMASLREDGVRRWIDEFLELGLVPPNMLAYASASTFTRAPGVAPDVGGATAMVEEAFRLWRDADVKARGARRSVTFADVLATAPDCLFQYNTAKVLLEWAVERYEAAGVRIPDDLQLEQQVVEELRVAMVDTIRTLGDNFVYEPVMLGEVKIRGEIQAALKELLAEFRDGGAVFYTKDQVLRVVEQAADDAVARNPLFPDQIMSLWRDVVTDAAIDLSSESYFEIPQILAERVRAALAGRFEDSWVVSQAQTIAARRHRLDEEPDLADLRDYLQLDATPGNRWIGRVFRRRAP